MASSLAFKRLAFSSTRFFKLLNPAAIRSIPSSFSSAPVRSFETSMNFFDEEGNHMFRFVQYFPDSEEMEVVDGPTDEQFVVTSRGLERVRIGEGYEIRQDLESLNLILKMTGFEKEDVKVSVENGEFIIKATKESEDYEFSLVLDMPPPDVYNNEQMKAEMKNGVLKIVFPRFETDKDLAFGSERRKMINKWKKLD